jgi:hypothetical protein
MLDFNRMGLTIGQRQSRSQSAKSETFDLVRIEGPAGWLEPMGPVFDRPDDKLRDTHQLHFMEMMDLAGLNPSCGQLYQRHCERAEAIHTFFLLQDGLLRRYAPRNDGLKTIMIL